METKKAVWSTPELTVHGSVEQITQAKKPIKPKSLGAKDDFGVVGISDA